MNARRSERHAKTCPRSSPKSSMTRLQTSKIEARAIPGRQNAPKRRPGAVRRDPGAPKRRPSSAQGRPRERPRAAKRCPRRAQEAPEPLGKRVREGPQAHISQLYGPSARRSARQALQARFLVNFCAWRQSVNPEFYRPCRRF